MPVELATAYVNIVPSTRDLASNLRGQLDRDMAVAGRTSGKQYGAGLAASAAGEQSATHFTPSTV